MYASLSCGCRLGGEAGHRGRADVLQAHGHRTERAREATQLILRVDGPREVVLDDADGRVESVIERWVPL
jgi:hypothetical protein